MSAAQISQILQVSRTWLFILKKQFPEEAPTDFRNVEPWRTFVKNHRVEPITLPEKRVGTRKAPRDMQQSESSAMTRYAEARARKTAAQAEIAELQLRSTKRHLIAREEIEAEFGRLASIMRGRLMRIANDMPCALCGKSEAEIELWAQDMIRLLTADLRLDAALYIPKRA